MALTSDHIVKNPESRMAMNVICSFQRMGTNLPLCRVAGTGNFLRQKFSKVPSDCKDVFFSKRGRSHFSKSGFSMRLFFKIKARKARDKEIRAALAPKESNILGVSEFERSISITQGAF